MPWVLVAGGVRRTGLRRGPQPARRHLRLRARHRHRRGRQHRRAPAVGRRRRSAGRAARVPDPAPVTDRPRSPVAGDDRAPTVRPAASPGGAARRRLARRRGRGCGGAERRGVGERARRRRDHRRLVRLRREQAPRRGLQPGARGGRLPSSGRSSLGPREFVAPGAARRPRRAGARVRRHGAEFLSLGAAEPSTDAAPPTTRSTRALAGRSLTALAPAPAQDANTFVVTPETAERLGLRTLSDLAAVAAELTLGGPPECPSRPICLAGLARRLRPALRALRARSTPAGRSPTRRSSPATSTSRCCSRPIPRSPSGDLVELADDRGLQPAENVTPLVRAEVVDRWGTGARRRDRRGRRRR